MKKVKIICLIICMLMTFPVFPGLGQFISYEETTHINLVQPPGPAYASYAPQNIPIKNPFAHKQPNTITTLDNSVIDILEQVDASTFLAYEENLTANGPRPTGSANCIAAAAYIYDQFQTMGLAVRYCPWTHGGYTSDNVEATLNGTNQSSDDIYIICAHYDTVAAGPGADDDTSGTVAVIMAAQIMSQYQFNHTIKFVCFSGEEQGLLGSAVYAEEAAAQGWDIIGVLNCDMISYAITTIDGNNLIVFEDDASEWLYTYTATVNTLYTDYIHLTLEHGGWTWGSDHNSFWDQGYSALFYFEYTETPYYHTAQDTIEHINASYAVKNMRLVFATLAELAGSGQSSTPPAPPVLTGPTNGRVNELYSFEAVTTEPDGEDVYYYFDWDDGTNSGWLGPYLPETPITAQHSWTALGTYTIRVKARDIYYASSDWSEPLNITIIAPVLTINDSTTRIGRFSCDIQNTGDANASNIIWTIHLDGSLIILGKTTTASITTLQPDATETIQSKFIFGFGKTNIIVSATCDEGANAEVTKPIFLLGPFLLPTG
jgi:aminopeptidase YwaD